MDRKDLRKYYRGCYRVTLDGGTFAQIIRGRYYSSIDGLQDRFERDSKGKFWCVEIRKTETGDLVRFAGVWSSLADAVEMTRPTRMT